MNDITAKNNSGRICHEITKENLFMDGAIVEKQNALTALNDEAIILS